jgi:NYN domain
MTSAVVSQPRCAVPAPDVNLATWMLTDAFENDCELAVLITNDSDLAEPVNIVASRCGKQVGLINRTPAGPAGR